MSFSVVRELQQLVTNIDEMGLAEIIELLVQSEIQTPPDTCRSGNWTCMKAMVSEFYRKREERDRKSLP